MAGRKSRPRIFYGWYIVAACFSITAITAGTGATFPVFFLPLIDEFNWSRTALSGTVSIGFVIGGLVTPLWGNWTDRSGGRVVVVAATVFAGFSLLLRAWVGTLWHLYLLSGLGALFFAGVGLIPLSTVISQWFRKKRGMAMGITLVGGGIGSFTMPPIANYFVETAGWRNTYLLLGAVLWAGIIPIAGLILRRSPEDIGLLPDGEHAESNEEQPAEEETNPSPATRKGAAYAEGLTVQQAVRTLSFWMIAVAFLLPMMSGVGLITHLVAIFKDMGVGSQTASVCLGLIGGLSIVGRFSFGFAADRFSVRKVFTACYIAEGTGVCMLLATPLLGANALYAYVLIYGLTGSAGLVLAPLIVGECFGLKSLGTIFGVVAIAAVIGGAIGPVLAGLIRDNLGSYYIAFVIFSICEVSAAVAISRARPALPTA